MLVMKVGLIEISAAQNRFGSAAIIRCPSGRRWGSVTSSPTRPQSIPLKIGLMNVAMSRAPPTTTASSSNPRGPLYTTVRKMSGSLAGRGFALKSNTSSCSMRVRVTVCSSDTTRTCPSDIATATIRPASVSSEGVILATFARTSVMNPSSG